MLPILTNKVTLLFLLHKLHSLQNIFNISPDYLSSGSIMCGYSIIAEYGTGCVALFDITCKSSTSISHNVV